MVLDSTILVVGGEPGERDNVLRTLGDHYRVISADSVHEALEFSNDSVELVICNMESKNANCLDLIHSWRAKHPDAPFVMLTEGHDVHSVVEAMRQGAADCIVKPIRPDELRTVVDRLFQGRRAEPAQTFNNDAPRGSSKSSFDIPPGTSLEDLERAAVEQALVQHHGNRTHAAKTLGISVRTLQRKLKAWGIPVIPFQGGSSTKGPMMPAHRQSNYAFGAPAH
jgi:DNA-binding NtrC family response regulator